MGHYLSDFETDDERMYRVIYAPMIEALRTYDAERGRGIVHGGEYVTRMETNRTRLRDKGYDV